MGQLTEEKACKMYPQVSNRTFILNCVYNAEDWLEKAMESYTPLESTYVVGIDTKTTDDSKKIAEEFGAYTCPIDWVHSFSHAKNQVIKYAMQNAGLKFGDWIQILMGHGVAQPQYIAELKEFIKNRQNFFGSCWVDEHMPNEERPVTRIGSWVWRHHPYIYLEKLCDETAVYSASRLTGLGVPWNDIRWKHFPIMGGRCGIIHNGHHQKGGEEGYLFQRDKMYYLILNAIQQCAGQYLIPLGEPSRSVFWTNGGWIKYEDKLSEHMLLTLQNMTGDFNLKNLDGVIEDMTERLCCGEIVYGISPWSDGKPPDLCEGHI